MFFSFYLLRVNQDSHFASDSGGSMKGSVRRYVAAIIVTT